MPYRPAEPLTPITPAATTRITTIADITGSSNADSLVGAAAGVGCSSTVGTGFGCREITGGAGGVVDGGVIAGTTTAGRLGFGTGGGVLLVVGTGVGGVVGWVGGVVGTVVGGGV
ncbi:MAG TPA: hypothetical protein VG317_17260 [Pseudonocardiaceae bacterium]|jgi:hypothetical protein|nr:hypothetical protein [Pseudonocardiaceae bacterium]